MHGLTLICCIILTVIYNSSAQERLGIVNSRYAGMSGLMLNPADIAKSPIKWEVHLLSFGLFIDNNYMFIPKTNILKLSKGSQDIILGNEETIDINGETADLVIRDRTANVNKHVYLDAMLKGPAFMICFGNFSIGMFTGVRAITSLRNSPFSAAKFGFEGLRFSTLHFQTFQAPVLKLNTMAWTEYGLAIGLVLAESDETYLKFGTSIKLLHGFAGVYLESSRLDFSVTPDTVPDRYILFTTNVNAIYGYTDPDSYDGGGYGSIKKGSGVGFDVGFAFAKKEDDHNYKWKAGVSILDIGSIKFDRDSKAFEIEDGTASFSRTDSLDFDGMADADSFISTKYYNNQNTAFSSNSFKMTLPTAMSLQFDYKALDFFYINATIVQRINFKGPGPQRSNITAITPRFEMKWAAVFIPIVLYEYKYPRIGFAVRAAYFTIGSDKIGSIFGSGKFSGTDIYASFKYFVDKESWAKARAKKGKTKTKKVKTNFVIPCIRWAR